MRACSNGSEACARRSSSKTDIEAPPRFDPAGPRHKAAIVIDRRPARARTRLERYDRSSPRSSVTTTARSPAAYSRCRESVRCSTRRSADANAVQVDLVVSGDGASARSGETRPCCAPTRPGSGKAETGWMAMSSGPRGVPVGGCPTDAVATGFGAVYWDNQWPRRPTDPPVERVDHCRFELGPQHDESRAGAVVVHDRRTSPGAEQQVHAEHIQPRRKRTGSISPRGRGGGSPSSTARARRFAPARRRWCLGSAWWPARGFSTTPALWMRPRSRSSAISRLRTGSARRRR